MISSMTIVSPGEEDVRGEITQTVNYPVKQGKFQFKSSVGQLQHKLQHGSYSTFVYLLRVHYISPI